MRLLCVLFELADYEHRPVLVPIPRINDRRAKPPILVFGIVLLPEQRVLMYPEPRKTGFPHFGDARIPAPGRDGCVLIIGDSTNPSKLSGNSQAKLPVQ